MRPFLSSIEPFDDDLVGPAVHGFLHRPAGPPGRGLVLTHGAGSDCDAPVLVAVAEAFARAGFTVLRCDLPFRQVRASGPPSPATAARDREGLRRAVTALRPFVPGAISLGGHSYGGRQASMLAADDAGLVEALLLLSYPLHPPRRTNAWRIQHFASLRTPALFVHGSRDPFGSVAELNEARRSIPGRTALITVEGGGHDLMRGGTGLPLAAIVQKFGNLRPI
ncbi:MAG TPA: alpha/beta family hydrolase [Candidatus Acidoferrum sp.]|nr:alpha/beta family hydrolase [Candidatus Acidoferrum sp.]